MKKNFTIALAVLGLLAFSSAAQETGETLVLEVDGMGGESCEDYIELTLLADIDGVRKSEADSESGIVEIQFDPELTSPDDLAEAVESCPSFEVRGSSTHQLAERSERRESRPCCSGSSCPIV